MDVRSIEEVAPVIEHNGTVPVWWLVNPREMKDITDGGFLELVSEFEVAGGGLVDPHQHPTHEFYYVTATGLGPRPHPLLLLRRRPQGRRPRRLQLSRRPTRGCWPRRPRPALGDDPGR
jgi:hypothetical protein